MVFQPINHSKAADAVVLQIEQLILHGVLRPGDRMPGERSLSRNLNVSRPVLRDALQELEARGLLVTRQGEGTQVADVVGTLFHAPVVELIQKHPQATGDYVEFRREIEGMAARFAAERATEADRIRLTEIVDRMRAAHEEADFSLEANIDVDFHQAVGECAHNIILLHSLRACYRLLEKGVFFNRSRLYSHKGSRSALLQQHLAIYDGIMARDPEAAAKAAQVHMDFVSSVTHEVDAVGAREMIAGLRLEQQRGQAAQLAGSSVGRSKASGKTPDTAKKKAL